MYLRLTTFTKNLPLMSFHLYFLLFLFCSEAPPMTLPTAGAPTDLQLPARASLFSEHILVRTSLPRCVCEIDAGPPPLCLLLSSYQMYVMSFSHLFPRLLFPATIPCIIVFSNPLWRVTWPKYFSFFTSYKIIQPVRW